MKGNILEAVIGAVVLMVASFFVYFAYTSSGEKVKQGYVLMARFDDVSGIMNGSDVKLNGIKIGVVKSLSLDENYQATVTLLIKEEIKVPKDSSASISTDGLMGNKFVSISPGFQEEKLEKGGEIKMTRSAVNLERLVDKFLIGGG
ncbi:MAG: outer membrane lipid asymmetry maintenance protein MlaD [Holosporales bacterium]|jgi:phospholipid/cholesterol/gamma-HCH transport system substrate-binding protein|nr:outer membrane lipid asymmetry maintenance protein MlaD [Holosporales bacterium]